MMIIIKKNNLVNLKIFIKKISSLRDFLRNYLQSIVINRPLKKYPMYPNKLKIN